MGLLDAVNSLAGETLPTMIVDKTMSYGEKMRRQGYLPTSDPRIETAFEYHKIMDDRRFWREMIDEMNNKLSDKSLGKKEHEDLKKSLLAKFERKAIIYRAYCDVVERPQDISERLNKLKKELKVFDEENAPKSEQIEIKNN